MVDCWKIVASVDVEQQRKRNVLGSMYREEPVEADSDEIDLAE